MLIPDMVQVEKIEGLAQEVMRLCRDTLAVKLRFLNPALSRLGADSVYLAAGYRWCADAVRSGLCAARVCQ